MTLLDFLKSTPAADREAFAKACGTSVEYLQQLAYGYRKPKIALAVTIERESKRKVTCESLLPEVDWNYLRGRERVAS